jgi:2-desacetyl-2-hydroxyethyl bacteriochlorophyllide A dehydrogenase
MKTVCLKKPGEFELLTTETPIQKVSETLVKVHRVGICGTDIHAYHGRQPFFSYPRILGHELGLEVLNPDPINPGLSKGDRCSLEPYFNCGTCIACRSGKPNCCTSLNVFGVHSDGGMRSVISVPTHKLHSSKKLSFDQLALVETLGIGAHAVERAAIKANEYVLIIGAGPIGLSVIQFAQAANAHVVVMDISESRLNFCSNYLKVKATLKPSENELDELKSHGNGDLPTVVIDATGNPKSMAKAFDFPAHGGRLLFVGLFQGDVTFNDPHFHRRELTLLASRNALAKNFEDIIHKIESGIIDTTPWITHRLKLDQIPNEFNNLSKDPSAIKIMVEVD